VLEIPIGAYLVRSWRDSDESAIVKYANNRNVWINLRDSFPFPYTTIDAQQWIHAVREIRPETAFAIANADEAIGGISFHIQPDVYSRSAEIGYWLGEPFWGKGIATAAVKAVTEYAFAHHDLVRLYAGVFEWNPASMRVLEKAGYVLEGRMRKGVFKDGKLIDQLMYSIVR
jgi:[ribosomal protein S5]-alanine N-acetyltransferase